MSEIWKRMFFLLVLIWSVGSIRGVGEEVSGHGVSIIAEEGVNRGSRVLGSPDDQGSIYILNCKQITDLGASLQAEDEIYVVVRGLDLSAATGSGFDDYGIVLSYAEDVVITDNVIAHRERAIHANNSCGLDISGNDLRGSGGASWDAALYLNNVCSTRPENDLRVMDNLFGPLGQEEVAAVQVVNSRNIITSGDRQAVAHITLDETMGMTYPLRYVNVLGGSIEAMDFSSSESQNGIGLRLLDCSDIYVQDLILRERGIALQITGGSGYQVNSCDMTLSGQDEDYSVMLLKKLEMNRPEQLNISGLTFDSDAPTVVNMIDCRGIHVASGLADSPGVELYGQMSGSAAIRIQGGGDITVRGLDFIRDLQETGSQAILAQNGVEGLQVEECRLNGFSTGINLESAQSVALHCNSLELNGNALHLSSDSEVSSCSQNSFRCNAIGIHNDSSNPLVSVNDYWGHPDGSSSYSGFGDYYIGIVDASLWADSIPGCIGQDSIPGCGFEICDNGIDDDGDGVIDCEDGSCLDQPDCQGLTPRSTRADEGPLLGSIVPNPNDGRFRVELGSEATQMFLLDTSGRIVRSLQLRSFEEFVEWDVRGVAPGLYRLVVTSGRERSSASVLIR